MSTKFRTMLAPIGTSTGDGRRFAQEAITTADTPFPFEWARAREGGHDGAVSIGVVTEVTTLSVADAVDQGWISADRVSDSTDPAMMAVWARGELHSVDRETMPRLAEDVAEAMHLMTAGTLGPSVDLDTFEGVPVRLGTDEPVTYEDMERHFEETGEEMKLELLVTAGRVRAATLVSIPAFAETSRPLELIEDDSAPEDTLALVASAGPDLPPADAYARPALGGPTPITWDFATGRVFGHVALWKTCHVGYSDVCVTPPQEADTYGAFNRFPVETEDGVVWAGRITAGGRHAGLALTANATMAEYDRKVTAAHVRAYADDHGIVVAGTISPDLGPSVRAVLDRRKVSGDWRETPDGLNLVEVLALSPGPRAHSEPGFPVAGTFSRAGRQVALTASFGPDPDQETRGAGSAVTVDVEALAAALDRHRAAQEARAASLAALRADLQEDDRERSAPDREGLTALLADADAVR